MPQRLFQGQPTKARVERLLAVREEVKARHALVMRLAFNDSTQRRCYAAPAMRPRNENAT